MSRSVSYQSGVLLFGSVLVRRHSLRAVTFYIASVVQWAGIVVTGAVGGASGVEPRTFSNHFIVQCFQWNKDNAWWLVLSAVAVTIVGKSLSLWAGPPWAWKSINRLLGVLRNQVFDAAPDDAIHDHRATLFKRRRNVLWIWPWRCSWCPWGAWRAPWSGWLVPVARSGHTTQRTNVVYLAPDDAANVEGIAGAAWNRNDVVLVVNLPELTVQASDKDVADYAKRTFVSEEWVRRRIKSGKPCPRALCGIPVEVDNVTWGTIVLDSCKPDGITHRRHNFATNRELIPLMLGEFLKRA